MEVAELLGAVFSVFLVVLIAASMASAGFTTTFANLAGRCVKSASCRDN